MVNWKNVQYANTAGLVDSIRANNADAAKANQDMLTSLQDAGTDFSDRKTAAFNSAIQMAQNKDEVAQLMANRDPSWLNMGAVNTAVQDRNKEFRDIATQKDTFATNALIRDSKTQALSDSKAAADRLQVTQGRTDDAYDIEQRKIAETDSMRLLMAHPTANNMKQLQNIAAYGQSTGVADDVYRDTLNTKRMAEARQAITPFEDIDTATEQDAIDYSNQINDWVDTNMPMANVAEKGAAVTEMTAATGLDNILARIKATRERKAEEALIDFKHLNDVEIEKIKVDGKKQSAWLKRNSSDKDSSGKKELIDRLDKMDFATGDWGGLVESPGTELIRILSPMIMHTYPDVKEANKVWKYFARSGFPTPMERGINKFNVGINQIDSDNFGEFETIDKPEGGTQRIYTTLKALINEAGVLKNRTAPK